MNLLRRIRHDAKLFEKINFKYYLYAYLLHDCSDLDDDGILYNPNDVEDLSDIFRTFGNKVVQKAVDDLEKEGLIKIVDNYCAVGVLEKGKPEFFGEEEKLDVAAVYTTMVEDAITSFIKDSPKGGISFAMAKRLKADFENLCSIKIAKFEFYNFTQLYNITYHACMQEEAREFLGKEIGQIKSLIRLYSPDILYQMIVYYLVNSNKYTKSLPTLGQLLGYKDTIYNDMRGGIKPKVSKSFMRTETEKDF